VPPGIYRLVLTVDGQEFGRTIRVEADPTQPVMIAAPEEDDAEEVEERPVIRIDD
jgi:hypothetical protein